MNVNWGLTEKQDIVIIGSGTAGSTAALYIARAGYHPIVLFGDHPYGQLKRTDEVENFPGWNGVGPDLGMRIEEQAVESGAEYRYETVVAVDLSSTTKKIVTNVNVNYIARVVIIATGMEPKILGLPNEKKYLSKGVYTSATCDMSIYYEKDVVVVGGNDNAIEDALLLTTLAKSVKLIHRDNELCASESMKKKLESSNVKVLNNTKVTDVLGDYKVDGIKVQDVKSKKSLDVQCDAVFLSIGQKPATDPFIKFINCDSDGYIKTDGNPETNIPGVLACGRCVDKVFQQPVVSACTGCQAALLAERYLQEDAKWNAETEMNNFISIFMEKLMEAKPLYKK